jgi:hypothetical protein
MLRLLLHLLVTEKTRFTLKQTNLALVFLNSLLLQAKKELLL